MRDVTDRRRIHPKRPHPPTVGIPDTDVVEITTASQLADEVAEGRPVLARASDGSLFTVPRDRPDSGCE